MPREDVDGVGIVRPSTVVQLATICVLVLLATAKVYSIQYVVWLVPLAALLGGRQFWLAAAIVALTIPIHPLLFAGLVDQEALPILVLNARNALLVGLLAWMLWDWRAGGTHPRPSGPQPDALSAELRARERSAARRLAGEGGFEPRSRLPH